MIAYILGKHIAGRSNILQDDRVNSYRGTCTNPLTIIFSRGRGVVLCCHPYLVSLLFAILLSHIITTTLCNRNVCSFFEIWAH